LSLCGGNRIDVEPRIKYIKAGLQLYYTRLTPTTMTPDNQKKKKRVPEQVQDKISDGDKIHLITNIGSAYPCEAELVTNGVILWNSRESRVFKYTEMLEIINGENERYEVEL